MNCNQHPFESRDIAHRFCAIISTERVFCAAPMGASSVGVPPCEPKTLLAINIVQAVAIAMLGGAVVQADGVSAGNGKVIDWREVKSGWTILDGADAYDTAQLFVNLVDVDASLEALAKHGMVLEEERSDAQPKREVPEVVAYATNARGERTRGFSFDGFRVSVQNSWDNEDDAAQASFTQWLAEQTANYTKTTPL